MGEIQDVIAQMSSQRCLDHYRRRGTGLYQEGSQRLLVVNGHEAFLWQGKQPRPIPTPVWRDTVFDWKAGDDLHPHLDTLIPLV